MARDDVGSRGERAVADNRVVGIRVDVDHGREVEIDAQVGQLPGQRCTQRPCLLRVVVIAYVAHRGPLGPGLAQALDAASLLVDGHRQGQIGGGQRVEVGHQPPDGRGRHDVAGEEHHAPDAPGRDQGRQALGDFGSLETGKQQLSRAPGSFHDGNLPHRGALVNDLAPRTRRTRAGRE